MYYTALLGYPVAHSISPILYRSLAKYTDIEYAHLKIEVESKGKLEASVQALKKLGFKGANITMPYKEAIIQYCTSVTEAVERIYAVNTIVFKDDEIVGYNTDSIAALHAIERNLKKIETYDKIVILGAGGAARAILFALYQVCDNITVLNRNPDSLEKLSRDLSVMDKKPIDYQLLTDSNTLKGIIEANIVINTTPVGMYPSIEDKIVPHEIYAEAAKNSDFKKKYFFDAIFNPCYPYFLLEASHFGAKICSGTHMMVFQAIKTFEIWTGHSLEQANVDQLNNLIMKYVTHIKN